MSTPAGARGAIFIHSLFRSGSTYLLEAFRRSPAGYWCYQEPLHERLLEVAAAPGILHEDLAPLAARLRHSMLSRPYFEEFAAAAELLPRLLNRGLIYDHFFSAEPEHAAALGRYFDGLGAVARGRPVFQECRTFARVSQLATVTGGTHVYLWRNPRDQWWSHKVDVYFDAVYLLALNAVAPPPLIQDLRQAIGFREFHDASLSKERAFFGANLPDAEGSYLLFYTLWCYGMVHGRKACAIDINIDQLSGSASYRSAMVERLEALGIGGLDFSDCSVPQAGFTRPEQDFFTRLESRAHELLQRHGLSGEVAELLHLRGTQAPQPAGESDGRAAASLREQLLRASQDNAALQRRLYEMEGVLQSEREVHAAHQRNLDALHRSLPWRLSAPLRLVYRLMRARR